MTKRETVYEVPSATMWYYPDKKIIHHRIHKFIYGQDFYNLLMTGNSLVKKYKARKWLSDDRDLPVLRQEDLDWGNTNWLPATVLAGWKYWAIIQPDKPAAKRNNEDLVKLFSSMGIVARYFVTEEEAMAWLESQE